MMVRQGLANTQRLKDMLEDEGILARIRPVFKNLSDEQNEFELSVLQSEVEQAHELISRRGPGQS